MLRNISYVIAANIVIFLRKIIGCKIQAPIVNMISPTCSLITREGGSIIIGKRSSIRRNSELSTTSGKIIIGENCFINRDCMIVAHDLISIGNNTSIGPGVYIYDHDHDGKGGYVSHPIIIGENVWIGAGCIILKGTTIGDNAVIGAGTLVCRDVVPGMMMLNKRETVIK